MVTNPWIKDRDERLTKVQIWIPKKEAAEFERACKLLGKRRCDLLRDLILAFLDDLEGFKALYMSKEE